MDNNDKVIAVDFDGIIVDNKYPQIGSTNFEVVRLLRKLRKNGYYLILNTCRGDNLLDEAIEHCRAIGLRFDAVNENLPHRIKMYNNDCRKIGADYYIDDKDICFNYTVMLNRLKQLAVNK